MLPQELVQQGLRTVRGQGVEPELGVGRLAPPALVIVGTIGDEQHEARRWQAVDQAVQQGLRLGVDPVQVLHDQEQGLHLARPHEQAHAGRQHVLAALHRIEGLPLRVVHGDV